MRRDSKVPGPPPRIFPFQPTRPRGARLPQRAVGVHHRLVSIHTPAWGATQVDGLHNFE